MRDKITQDAWKKVFACSGPSQAHNLSMNVFSNMNTGSGTQLCIFLVGCHPSNSHLAIQPVDYVSDLCMWLAFWRLSPICCFSLYWLGWILWKSYHGAIWRLTLKNLFFLQKYTDNNSTQRGCSNEGHGFFHSRKNSSRCLKIVFAFSGPNQANNLTNIFDMNVLSNMTMRLEDSLLLADLRFCCMLLPEKGSWQGRLEAQGYRRESWLAMLKASSAIMSHGANKCSWSRGHLCLKCSALLACKGAAFNSFSNSCFPSYTLPLPSICGPCRLLSRNSVQTMADFSI